MKNLVIIHMECLSNEMLYQYRTSMPRFWSFLESSKWFTNCHVAGASTIFAFNGIAYGSVSGLDSLVKYEHDGYPDVSEPSIFEHLMEKHGYVTRGFLFAEEIPEEPMTIYTRNLPGITFRPAPILGSGKRLMEDEFSALAASGKPFVVFVCNTYGRGEYDLYFREEYAGMGTEEVARLGFGRMDEAFGGVVDLLDRNGVRDNTTLLCYGDHGVPLFNRMYNSGEAHGTHLCKSHTHVPLAVGDSSLEPEACEALTSLDDTCGIMRSLLLPGEPFESSLFGRGADALGKRRELCFMQNKYALQIDLDDPVCVRKSYGVVDGEYRLIAKSPGKNVGMGGMELYQDRLDPANVANLLDLFELDGDGNVVDYTNHRMQRPDCFFAFYNPEKLVLLARKYHFLRDRLREYVERKEANALLHYRGSDAPHRFSPDAFTFSASGTAEKNHLGIAGLKAMRKDVVLFGASLFGRQVCTMLAFHNIPVLAYIDNSPAMRGREFDGVEVRKPDDFAGRKDVVVVGCSIRESILDEMRLQSEQLGLPYLSYSLDIRGYRGGLYRSSGDYFYNKLKLFQRGAP